MVLHLVASRSNSFQDFIYVFKCSIMVILCTMGAHQSLTFVDQTIEILDFVVLLTVCDHFPAGS